jgi:LAO/AO transport system kinase
MKPSCPSTEPHALPPRLWEEFLAGSRRACARVITRVENDFEIVPKVRDLLSGKLGRAVRVGITGPPGVGKSTLCAAIAVGLADAGHRIGVIAVDPSSPFSGGAFMGDRIRMDRFLNDDRIFMRSLASREGHGGLSPATPYVADVLEGFGLDRILIETVGVGQAELDVLTCVDLVILVLQPATGDAIQTLKAGILEAADMVVVNKADLPGVGMMIQSLQFAYGIGAKAGGRKSPPILATSADKSTGIEDVVRELEAQTKGLLDSGRHAELKRARIEAEIESAIRRRLWEMYEESAEAADRIRREAERLAESGESPYPFVRRECELVEIRIQKGEKYDGNKVLRRK